MQGKRLYVGNLDYTATSEDVKEMFSAFGDVVEVKVIERKGFGFVEMGSQAEAEKAKEELDGSDFKGRSLRVNEAIAGEKRKPRRSY
jgi:RNA recognition motif-containing protein